jgi:2-amino-4-hydroxy-6-hydroxymethyldihydropteridine diphosphokinase
VQSEHIPFQLIILLGGNAPETAKLFTRAIPMLENAFGPVRASSAVYQSKAWGYDSTLPYLNSVLVFETRLQPTFCLTAVLEIEKLLGRVRSSGSRYSDRSIDIDLLFCGNQVVSHAALEIPHPRLHLRKFTLVPLAEVFPTFIHPVLNQSVAELLEKCPDVTDIKPVKL